MTNADDQEQKTSQKFGGTWTKEKLNIFTKYLEAYLVALKNMKFKKIYIDAFAGTGEIVTNDEEQEIIGSAKSALLANSKFDHYYFIEKEPSKVAELQEMVDTEFVSIKNRVTIYCGNANDKLSNIINNVNWRYSRALLFLDPYATQVNWSTLEIIAKTKSIDVWYLFPFSVLNRLLPRRGINPAYEGCIDRLLGDTKWRTEFYKEDLEVNLFDENERNFIKNVPPDGLKNYIIARLESVFPCVSKKARIFRNKKNSPLFLFCFAISNESKSAQKLALRIADYILKSK
ncbi:three-Cys-motif partner protein TcmP [uncultured Phascolarctobacterium sp.]|uniref:three-Cys-motif partner protein TcmP n=1 Tax=uncultured Phascolarctobacterium sp. TaxID=512296 RepID=UPI0027D97BE4|nr:three-Cys-motif partner protein TcmP [uncultured Phascolarctobacterium sp.]